VLKGPIKKEESKQLKEVLQQPTMKNIQEEVNGVIRTTPSRRPPTLMYQNIFLGVCYSCNNFGHKVIYNRAYTIGRNIRNNYENLKNCYEGTYGRKSHENFNTNYNCFGSLRYKTECYKCKKFGHSEKL